MILLIVCASFVLAGYVILRIFRFYVRSLGMERTDADGIVMTETGIEFPRFLFLGNSKISYSQIESVELVPFPANQLLRSRYGKAVSSRPGPGWGSFIQDTVLIKLKPPRLIEYEAFHPRNPTTFYNELSSRIEQCRKINTPGG